MATILKVNPPSGKTRVTNTVRCAAESGGGSPRPTSGQMWPRIDPQR